MHSRSRLVFLVLVFLAIGTMAEAGDPSYVFVTSTLHDGNLGGLDGADAICNQRAAGNLPGTYTAWLSTATVAAWERVYDDPDGYRLHDGSPVALQLEDVCACSDVDCLINAINQTETGDPAPTNTNIGFATAWTGTWINDDACVIYSDLCLDWTYGASGGFGRVGDPTDVNLFWTEGSWDTDARQRCNGEYSLYCFQNAPMFEDGFESGDTSEWSVTVP